MNSKSPFIHIKATKIIANISECELKSTNEYCWVDPSSLPVIVCQSARQPIYSTLGEIVTKLTYFEVKLADTSLEIIILKILKNRKASDISYSESATHKFTV